MSNTAEEERATLWTVMVPLEHTISTTLERKKGRSETEKERQVDKYVFREEIPLLWHVKFE